ncbi:MAG: class I SAM-dependent methyltransferase [Verrucomicrobiales bacterium]
MRLTQQAHEAVKKFLKPGDFAIDATAGNGHDTLFLAQQVGEEGRVAAFDIQLEALEASARLLASHALQGRVGLFHASHDELASHLPQAWKNRVRVVMMNLGYLPGGDHTKVTTTRTTMSFLGEIHAWLAARSLISILAYRGHEGGKEEHASVLAWAEQSPFKLQRQVGPHPESPELFLLSRTGGI